METGVKIRILREYNNLSRESMAELLGMSTNTYQKIETGERVPNIKEIQLISQKFSVDPSIFFENGNISIINGDNSPGGGMGNIVSIDKDLLKSLIKMLDRLSMVLDKL